MDCCGAACKSALRRLRRRLMRYLHFSVLCFLTASQCLW